MKGKLAILAVIVVAAAAVFFTFTNGTSQQTAGKSKADMITRGQYLVTVGGCNDCHTPKVMTEMGPMPDSSRLLMGHPASENLPPLTKDVVAMAPDKWLAVANFHLSAWQGPWGVSFAINLTPDKATGTGSWTEAAFIKAMRTGKHLGAGRPILPPMPWFNLAAATDDDLKAIFAYLQSIPPIQNEVPLPIPPEQPEEQR